MLYKLLNILFRISQFIYFKDIEIEGVEKIQFNEANLLIANHPSAFKDPILIGANFSSPIYFLAAEEFMGGPKTSVFLESNFNMIPIYRPSTQPDEIHKNNDSFNKCYGALNDKKSILIFAEGHSETQNWLDPLKTGSARIALESMVRYTDLENVNIVPVGLNYSNPHQFRSTFHLKIGDIIKISRDTNLDKSTLTSLAYEGLRETVNGQEKEESYWQDKFILWVTAAAKLNMKDEHVLIGRLIKELDSQKEKFSDIKGEIELLELELRQKDINLIDYVNFKKNKKINYLNYSLLTLLFIPGFLINSIPIYLLKFFVKNRDFKYSFEGSMYFAFGTLFTLIWHLLIVSCGVFIFGWYSMLIPVGMIFTGWIALKCRDYLLPYYQSKKLRKKIGNDELFNTIYLKIDNRIDLILNRFR